MVRKVSAATSSHPIYCVKCKAKTGTKDLHEAVSKNGRKMIKGVCSICGTKKNQFVKK